MIPIFPELRPFLMGVFEAAEPGTQYVITRYRDANQNLRTQLQRIMRGAAVTPWPRLFHNLRSTRQTELEESYPSHVVCAWLGNSEKVARANYLQLRDSHFEQAATGEVCRAAQKAAQQPSESTRTRPQATRDRNEKTPDRSGVSRCLLPVARRASVTPTGFEPVSRP